VLDLVTRRLFSAALQPLVGSGEVPCQDREGALTALRTRPIETFDFHHPNAVTAHWARENFEVLGPRLSVELAQRCALPAREVSFWVETLFRFAATPVENPVRLRALADSVHAGSPADGVLMERLEALLGMLAQLMRVVLVADDLEGFSTDETAALRLAAFLGELRQSVERLDVILSLNQDIWQSAFVPRLSGGLADRLSEVVVELNPLTEDEMVALLESRVPGLGARVLSRMDRDSAGTHARGLIRAAGVAWLRASAMDSQTPTTPAPATPVPVAVPPPVAELPPVLPEPAPPEPQAPIAPEVPPVAEVTIPEPPVPQAPVFEAAAEPPPFKAAEPAVAEPVVPAFEAAAPVERAPDPTLAIAFLAASAKEEKPEVWPPAEIAAAEPEPPVISAPEPKSPIQAAVEAALAHETGGGFQPAQVFTPSENNPFQAASEPLAPSFTPPASPFSAFQPVQETPAVEAFSPPPVVPAFQAAAEPPSPEPAFFPPPPPAFQAAPEPPPVFAPIAAEPPAPAFVPEPPAAPAAAFQPVVAEEGTKAPDTDRVDDLLRQFRERYGRGSL
jgi:hypothetical protein